MKDGYTLYALKMVYGGFGAFVMVNFILTIAVMDREDFTRHAQVMFLLVDTQMIMLGRHKYSYNPEDWAFAALSIYTDITSLFLYILMLVGVSDSG